MAISVPRAAQRPPVIHADDLVGGLHGLTVPDHPPAAEDEDAVGIRKI